MASLDIQGSSNNVTNSIMCTEPLINVEIKEEEEMIISDFEQMLDGSNSISCTNMYVQNIKEEMPDSEQTVDGSNSISCTYMSDGNIHCSSDKTNRSKIAAEANATEFNNTISIVNVTSCFNIESSAENSLQNVQAQENFSNNFTEIKDEMDIKIEKVSNDFPEDVSCSEFIDNEKEISERILTIKEENMSDLCDLQTTSNMTQVLGNSDISKTSCIILDSSFIFENQKIVKPEDILYNSTLSSGNIHSLSNPEIYKENEHLSNGQNSISLNIKTEDVFELQNYETLCTASTSNVSEKLNACVISTQIKSEDIYSGQITDMQIAANTVDSLLSCASSFDNTQCSGSIESNSSKNSKTGKIVAKTSSSFHNAVLESMQNADKQSGVLLNNGDAVFSSFAYSDNIENGNISKAAMKFGKEIADPLVNLKSLCGQINANYIASKADLPLPWAVPVQNIYCSSSIASGNNYSDNGIKVNDLLFDNESENLSNKQVIILNSKANPISFGVKKEQSNSSKVENPIIVTNDQKTECRSNRTIVNSENPKQILNNKNISVDSSSVKIWEIRDKQNNVLRGVDKNVLQSLIKKPFPKNLSVQEKSLMNETKSSKSIGKPFPKNLSVQEKSLMNETKSNKSIGKDINKPSPAVSAQNCNIWEVRDRNTVMRGINENVVGAIMRPSGKYLSAQKKSLSISEKKSEEYAVKHVDIPSPAVTVQNHNIWEVRDKNTIMRGIDKNILKRLLKKPSGALLSVAQKNIELKTIIKNAKQDNKNSDQKSPQNYSLLKSHKTYPKIKPRNNEMEKDTKKSDQNEPKKTVPIKSSKKSSKDSIKSHKTSHSKEISSNEKEELKRELERANSEQNASKISKLIEPLYKYMDGRKCTLCGFESKASDIYSAKRHMIIHLESKNFKCNTCNKHYISPESLMSHISHAHSDKSEHTCNICAEKFSSIYKLRRHKEKHSAADKSYKCIVCSRELTNRNSLRAHYRIHTGERPYECSTCSKTFRTRSMLKSHSLRHNPKSHQCEYCEKTYHSKKALAQHMFVHNEYLRCDVCGKRFNTKSNLAQHMVVHSEDRPHNCETCGMKFKLPHHLRSHLTTHH